MLNPQRQVHYRSRPAQGWLVWLWVVVLGAPGFAVAADNSEAALAENHPSTEALEALQGIAVHPDLEAELFASEPLFTNPVSFAFDDQGRCYVVETHRRRTSVYDIRRFKNWLDADLSMRSVADRRRFLEEAVREDNPDVPEAYHIDRNGDGVFNVRDLEVESERVLLLTDGNQDGLADQTTVFADDFRESVSGVAAGVLPFGDSVWFTCIPDLWRLRDVNGDGEADERQALLHGFGVHIAFGGHDFHGVIMGPDGRLYFSIADRGARVERDGAVLASLPDTGAVFRCQPDGSEFEVVATGLRNPQELAFDERGDLWTVDNNGDAGDKARLVHVVEGGESGWTIGWQWLSQLGAWNGEGLWQLEEENSARYLLPPVAHIGHGPAGLAYNPGTGLPEAFDRHFFLADFPGGVRAFRVEPKGASYRLVGSSELLQDNSPTEMNGKLIWDISPVDVGFGARGGLYVADWTRGWEKPGKGRIFRVFQPGVSESKEVKEVAQLLRDGMAERSVKELADLLGHADQRVRMRAQFELAKRYQPSRMAVTEVITGALGLNPLAALKRVIEQSENPLARYHAIWGLGQIIAKHQDMGSQLIPYLADADPEIRTQVAKTLADRGVVGFYSNYSRVIEDPHPRVRFYGALWLGKTVARGYHEIQTADGSEQLANLRNTSPIFEMIRQNADDDAYLRHAGVMALTWINDLPSLVDRVDDRSPAVRLAAVLALRRLQRPEVSAYLNDSEPQIVLEAARAIYDLGLAEALPQLAAMTRQQGVSVAVLRRALHALFRLGKTENAAFLVAFAENPQADEGLRVEALEVLGMWANPPKRDPVTGLWSPVPERDGRSAIVPLRLALPKLLADPSERLKVAAIQALSALGIGAETDQLRELLTSDTAGEASQLAALEALANHADGDLIQFIQIARLSRWDSVRTAAGEWQAKLPLDDAIRFYRSDLAEGSVALRRAALKGLAQLEDDRAGRLIEGWFDTLTAGDLDPSLVLDVLMAAEQSRFAPLSVKLKAHREQGGSTDRLKDYRATLVGGNAANGRQLFSERQDLACARCHKIGDLGGDVGPNLSTVGGRLSREQILEAIVLPNESITAGFESVVVELKDGSVWSGLLKSESESTLVISSLEDGDVEIPLADVATRRVGLSAMPEETVTLMSKPELRDLIEFLATQT